MMCGTEVKYMWATSYYVFLVGMVPGNYCNSNVHGLLDTAKLPIVK